MYLVDGFRSHSFRWMLFYSFIIYGVLFGPSCASSDHSWLAGNLDINHTSKYFTLGNTQERFGLKDSFTWPSLLNELAILNNNGDDKIFRFLVLGRHGEGYHNVGEAKYGSKAWNEKWAALDGDDVITWGPDANLTERGLNQSRQNNAIWLKELHDGLAWPVLKYSSPLSRTLQTAQLTFNISAQATKDTLHVLEELRETLGVHTCDERSSRSRIQVSFPFTTFDHDFTEFDELWTPDRRETEAELQDRAQRALARIMSIECDQSHANLSPRLPGPLSITTHSGFIRNLLTSFNVSDPHTQTAGYLPLILEARCQQRFDIPESEDFDSDAKRIFLV